MGHVAACRGRGLQRRLRRRAVGKRSVRLEIERVPHGEVALVVLAKSRDVIVRVVQVAGQDVLDRRRHDRQVVKVKGNLDIVEETRIREQFVHGLDRTDLRFEIVPVQRGDRRRYARCAADVGIRHHLDIVSFLRPAGGNGAIVFEFEGGGELCHLVILGNGI